MLTDIMKSALKILENYLEDSSGWVVFNKVVVLFD